MTQLLDGKVALVTGGSSGIGRASALAFAREGARVVVADRSVDGGEETVRMIKETGTDAIFVRVDVSQALEVEEMLGKTIEAYGRLDCAFNNAGVNTTTRTSTHQYLEDEWDRVIGVNLKGVWLCMKYEIMEMLKQGTGSIVNTSSIYGLVGAAGTPAYTASKHGVAGLTKASALEYASQGIRVNAVCPGYIRTPMVESVIDSNPGLEEWFISREPIGRLGTPQEVAEAAVWLCSDAASFVTGLIMPVDGGVTAQ